MNNHTVLAIVTVLMSPYAAYLIWQHKKLQAQELVRSKINEDKEEMSASYVIWIPHQTPGDKMKSIIALITFKEWRDCREAVKRLANYKTIKAMIVECHIAGQDTVYLPKRFDAKDILSFPRPMYKPGVTSNGLFAIKWDTKLMGEEIGLGRKDLTTSIVDADDADEIKQPSND